MKKMKRLFAVLLAMAMVLGMSVVSFAANGTPEKDDTVSVKITGLGEGATVSLYQIAEGKYGNKGESGLVEYVWATDAEDQTVKFANVNAPTANELNAIAVKIKAGELKDSNGKVLAPITDGTVSGTEYTYQAHAGAYVAIITGGEGDSYIYNPILLTATYVPSDVVNEEGEVTVAAGNLQGGVVPAGSTYAGTTAVAKKSKPSFEKELVSGTTTDQKEGEDIETAGVGDVVTYRLDKIEVPQYPSNAKNKTFFITDRMNQGLDFDFSSLTVTFEEEDAPKVKRIGNNFVIDDGTEAGGAVIATAAQPVEITDEDTSVPVNGFNISFKYDAMLMPGATGAIWTPVLEYKAVITPAAVVGEAGNPNVADLYYANDPNNGTTWEPVDQPNPEPQEGSGIEKFEDEEIVYTYQLAFKKVGEGDEAAALAGARFGIYGATETGEIDETNLIDTVTSNESGIAVSTKVGKGTYFIKEIWAPSGYTLNDTSYKVEASWSTATKKITTAVTVREYTTNANESQDGVQVGWLKDGVFYNFGNEPEAEEGKPVEAAYTKSESTTTTGTIETTTNTDSDGNVTEIEVEQSGTGTVTLNGVAITNTKLASLPSTGGIGTTIFTIAGCLIMVAAAALFFASRKKTAAK